MRTAPILGFLVCTIQAVAALEPLSAVEEPISALSSSLMSLTQAADLTNASPPSAFWKTTTGGGYRKGAGETGFALGAGFGVKALGTTENHDLALATFHITRMITDPVLEGTWFCGNLELGGELFVGAQFHPESASLVGLDPVFRYNFATGTRWVPFVDVAAGVMAVSIGLPDLSTTFEFNEQVGVGVRWLFGVEHNLTFQYRVMHISNAGIQHPNNGVNSSVFYIGWSWLF